MCVCDSVLHFKFFAYTLLFTINFNFLKGRKVSWWNENPLSDFENEIGFGSESEGEETGTEETGTEETGGEETIDSYLPNPSEIEGTNFLDNI